MDDLLQFLFIALFIFLSVAGKKKKKIEIPDAIPVPEGGGSEREFPEEMTDLAEKESVLPSAGKPAKASLSQVSSYQPVVSEPVRTVKKSAPKEKKPSAPSAQRIHLHNRSEARKAFLYSEIFSRKYEH